MNWVKAIVYVGDRRFPVSYADSVIILPAVGVCMERERKAKYAKAGAAAGPIPGRPTIPPDVLRLHDMWSSGRGAIFDTECCYCNGYVVGPIRTCWLCMVTSHDICAEQVRNSVFKDDGVVSVVGVKTMADDPFDVSHA